MINKGAYCSWDDCQSDWNKENPECLGCGVKNYKACPNYLGDKEEVVKSKTSTKEQSLYFPWNSNTMGNLDIEWLSNKSYPIIIGLVGPPNSGKTTLLAALYMLLRKGESIENYSFAGSYTLLGWEKIAGFMTLNGNKKLNFPPRTSSNTDRIPGMLHLRLKDSYGQFKDILFTDAPGEWFIDWAKSALDNNSKGARWIDEYASAFIVFADSKSFNNDTGNARMSLTSIVDRMKDTHKNRPTALVWTKSDTAMRIPSLKETITEQVRKKLTNIKVFETAVINRSSEEVLLNILELVNYLLEEKKVQKNSKLEIEKQDNNDFFFLIGNAKNG